MTLEQAKWLKSLRAEGYSWRAIAREWTDKYPKLSEAGWTEPVSGNQIFGWDLCREAAKVLDITDEEFEDD